MHDSVLLPEALLGEVDVGLVLQVDRDVLLQLEHARGRRRVVRGFVQPDPTGNLLLQLRQLLLLLLKRLDALGVYLSGRNSHDYLTLLSKVSNIVWAVLIIRAVAS